MVVLTHFATELVAMLAIVAGESVETKGDELMGLIAGGDAVFA